MNKKKTYPIDTRVEKILKNNGFAGWDSIIFNRKDKCFNMNLSIDTPEGITWTQPVSFLEANDLANEIYHIDTHYQNNENSKWIFNKLLDLAKDLEEQCAMEEYLDYVKMSFIYELEKMHNEIFKVDDQNIHIILDDKNIIDIPMNFHSSTFSEIYAMVCLGNLTAQEIIYESFLDKNPDSSQEYYEEYMEKIRRKIAWLENDIEVCEIAFNTRFFVYKYA